MDTSSWGVSSSEKEALNSLCTASCQGKSVNGELLQGPDLTNPIGVLTRLRHDHIALMSDIGPSYHQVKVVSELGQIHIEKDS